MASLCCRAFSKSWILANKSVPDSVEFAQLRDVSDLILDAGE
jgi:hypothetical protein